MDTSSSQFEKILHIFFMKKVAIFKWFRNVLSEIKDVFESVGVLAPRKKGHIF